MVLTHAHLDHSGYLPRLVKDGFGGKIFCTHATAAVAGLILRDAGHLQEKDAEHANRHGYSRHRPALPLYTVDDAEKALARFVSCEFHQPIEVGGASARFRHAGHILGAAHVQLDWGGVRIVFSGDLGRFGDPVMVDPEPAGEADFVVVESTYGDRLHDPGDPTELLGQIVERTTRRGGTVIVPAFAVGRAQLLLYHLWKLKSAGRIGLVPVFLDSPMAENATDLYRAFPNDHRLGEDLCGAVCSTATYARDVEASKAISASPVPKVVISASGMATGGRVLHHIKAFGPDPKSTILFCGFQAAGTRGRALLEGAREVKIHGDWVPIRAEVADLPMLSAHADAGEILRWLGGLAHPPKRVFIVHGEPGASEALRVRVGRELGWPARVPLQGQVQALSQ